MFKLKTNKNWTDTLSAPLFGAVAIILTACGGGSTLSDNENNVQRPVTAPPAETTTIPVEAEKLKVALMLPLTGPHRDVGQALNQAAQLALFDVPSENFELFPKDTQGTEAGTLAAYQEARAEGISLILGPVLSNNVAAIKEQAKRDAVPIVSFSNNSTVAETGVWTFGFAPEAQINRVINYAHQKGYKNYAGLFPNSAYGTVTKNAFEQAVSTMEAELHKSETFNSNLGDLPTVMADLTDYADRVRAVEMEREELLRRGDEAALTALKELENVQTSGQLNYEALMIGAGGTDLQQISQLLASYDIHQGQVRLLGTGLWDDPNLVSLEALSGSWIAVPDPASRQSFVMSYSETFGQAPPRLATLAYDATALAALMGSSYRETQTVNLSELTDATGFAGVDGIFRLHPDGSVERGLAILEFKDGTTQLVDPAPTSFIKY